MCARVLSGRLTWTFAVDEVDAPDGLYKQRAYTRIILGHGVHSLILSLGATFSAVCPKVGSMGVVSRLPDCRCVGQDCYC